MNWQPAARHRPLVSRLLWYILAGGDGAEYIDSTPLAEADLSDAATLGRVMDLIKRAHVRIPEHLRGPALSFSVFHILRDYAATLREQGSAHQARLGGLLQHAAALERAVGAVDLALGHNDLLPANILRAGQKYWLIDWEYDGFNSPLFDLGGTGQQLRPRTRGRSDDVAVLFWNRAGRRSVAAL